MQATSQKDVRRELRGYLRSRADLGICNAVRAKILMPQNPFEALSFRKPQQWFVFLLIIASALAGVIIFFNFSN